MHHDRPGGAVTNSTGNLDHDGQILGYRGTGTAIDPGRYHERPGLTQRLATAIDAATPELAADQLAGVRRLLGANEART